MKTIRVAAAALNTTPLDVPGNRSRCAQAVEEARAAGAELVCLPELCLTGYGCEDAFHGAGLARRAWRALGELLPQTRGLVVTLGLPVRHNRALYNCAALCVDGKLAGLTAKQHLAGDGIHYEPRWFTPWPSDSRTLIEPDGLPSWDPEGVPLGDLIFEVGGLRIGFEICEDAWVAERPGARLASRAADVILNPSASHFAFGRRDVRERLVSDSSRAFEVTYLYANLLGNEAGRALYDGGSLVASAGEIVARAERFRYCDHTLAVAVVDVEATRLGERRRTSVSPAVEDAPGSVVCIEYGWSEAGAPDGSSPRPTWEDSSELVFEEFTRAVALGLGDYLRKSHSKGFVVSLSGGVDSAATACLVERMVRFGSAELGVDGLADRLGIARPARGEALTEALLTCIYQGTENSSETTREAARVVAAGLHARFLVFDVEPLCQLYRDLGAQALGRPLDWEKDDLALQNVQARARGPSVWLVANLTGALLLTTSNRSEAAVGYATMDGDTCGGLAPIAGADKSFLLEWLRWMERDGNADLGPVPALGAVNTLPPTAELRPPERAQRDEQDLMPYAVLDEIEPAAIRDRRTPVECLALLEDRFPELERERLAGWVARFFRLFRINQWKRERLAPSFHLDDENLDPKTWCRFPILSGGLDELLAEMARSTPTETSGDQSSS